MTNNNRNQIDKRIAELQKEDKTYILFYGRYLLEGKQISLLRNGENLTYFGDRFTDYGVQPPKVIDIKDSVTCSSLEKMFESIFTKEPK